jgi:CRP-like cAMP-binding protein
MKESDMKLSSYSVLFTRQGKEVMNELIETIRRYAFFDGMQPAHLAILTDGAREGWFGREDVLFREGEPASCFYLIQSGRIALEAHKIAGGAVSIQTLGPGEVLGWSWLFPPFVWHLQARALEPTKVLILNGAHLLVAAERDHDFGYELMKRVAQVVIHRLQGTRKLLLQQQD